MVKIKKNSFLDRALLVIFLFGSSVYANTIPIESFTKDPAVSDISISPDGKHLAIVHKGKKAEDLLTIIESKSKKCISSFGIVGKRESVDKVYWVSNSRLIYSAKESYFRDRGERQNGELYGVNIDGTNQRNIFGYRSGRLMRGGNLINVENGTHDVIDLMENEPKHILLSFYP